MLGFLQISSQIISSLENTQYGSFEIFQYDIICRNRLSVSIAQFHFAFEFKVAKKIQISVFSSFHAIVNLVCKVYTNRIYCFLLFDTVPKLM